jgi:hypothetical protein
MGAISWSERSRAALQNQEMPMDLALYARSLESDLDAIRKLLTAFEAGTLQAGTRRPAGEWEDVTERTIQLYKRMIITYEASLTAVRTQLMKSN